MACASTAAAATTSAAATTIARLTLNPGQERQMRFMYFTRLACDGILRDVVKELCRKQSLTWEAWGLQNIKYIKKYQMYKDLKYDKDGVPLLEESDTTFLVFILRKISAKDQGILNEVETLRNLRNQVSHCKVEDMSSDDYKTEFHTLQVAISKLRHVSPNVQKYLDFLARYQFETFTDFCSKFPAEMKTFVETLESQKFLPLVESLSTMVKENRNLIKEEVIERKCEQIKNVEKLEMKIADEESSRKEDIERLESEIFTLKKKRVPNISLPTSNIPELAPILGRDKDLDDMKENVNTHPLTLITGPPGVGKTSLALTFAKNRLSVPDTCCLKVELRSISAKAESNKDLKQVISREIGKQFRGIANLLAQADNPYDILEKHIQDIIEYSSINLIVILDNVDDILTYQKETFETMIENLTSPEKRISFICTARERTMNPGNIQMGKLSLQPISEDVCEEWLSSELKNHSVTLDLIRTVASHCGGIPLMMKIFASGIKNNWITEKEHLPEFKESSDWQRLKESLHWSFSKLDPLQLKIMQCASVFVSSFEQSTMEQLFNCNNSKQSFIQKLFNTIKGVKNVSSNTLLHQCFDLSLLEFDKTRKMFFCHPYIQEYVQVSYPKEFSDIASDFFFIYYSKLIDVAKKQLTKDEFVSTMKSFLADMSNYEKFLKVCSTDVSCLKELKEMNTEKELSYYWLLAAFWFLDKLPVTQQILLQFAKELELIFTKINLLSHVIMCKAFLSHKLRLKNDVDDAKNKLEEASKMFSDKSPHFCKGYVYYSMGRFIQHMDYAEHTGKLTWERQYPWESQELNVIYTDALEQYARWEDPIKSERQITNIEGPSFSEIVEIENIEVLSAKYRRDLKESEVAEKQDIFEDMRQQADKLNIILGNHGECSYANKKLGDLLSYSGQQEEAALVYEKSYNMNEVLAKETGVSYVSNILILKNWATCIMESDPALAMSKLVEAEELLEENYMSEHEWAGRVQKIKSKTERYIKEKDI